MAKTNSRLKMINAAIDLFHRKGVNATSVDDVLEKSGTGKSQFTHYFKNKAGLVEAAVSSLSEEIKSGRTPTGYRIESWKEMERWFQTYIDFQESVGFARSCPVCTIGNDLAEDQSEARDSVVAFLVQSGGAFLAADHGLEGPGGEEPVHDLDGVLAEGLGLGLLETGSETIQGTSKGANHDFRHF